ncbi:hypothetical protein CNMCM8980_003872 [Aspergillus fumigatiaffinis]|uniref:Uncharacterized protein n=1 Tax=Aspergillus fumigatiaffinis TaxID=340414 RepID=A0A8H4GH36_9EURO|nr:hypothetical protein CNMCM5878_002229 [Aspergillus fumigatiaffinis]KAF4222480.1 hypothetical protein CNMCM6457_001370 [Aspergillus fumigatiaffinis]KAF4228537.1 hypothetical protein CNMCM6805_001996 [Aspergillus fumigatiaffinis]KAF4234451.1 hypothetical protein CNMCM8980_003872 [Aspergillus fumigatiaffinis]
MVHCTDVINFAQTHPVAGDHGTQAPGMNGAEAGEHGSATSSSMTPGARGVLGWTQQVLSNPSSPLIITSLSPSSPLPRRSENRIRIQWRGCTQCGDLQQAAWTGAEGTPRDLMEALTEKQYMQRAVRFMLNTGRLTYLAEATEPAWLEPSAPSR